MLNMPPAADYPALAAVTWALLAFLGALVTLGLLRACFQLVVALASLRLQWRAGTFLGGWWAQWTAHDVVAHLVSPEHRAGALERQGGERHSLLYRAYMQSDAWGTRRARTLLLAGGACQHCGARATDAHHTTYAHLGAERDTELLALCARCHAREHGRAHLDGSSNPN